MSAILDAINSARETLAKTFSKEKAAPKEVESKDSETDDQVPDDESNDEDDSTEGEKKTKESSKADEKDEEDKQLASDKEIAYRLFQALNDPSRSEATLKWITKQAIDKGYIEKGDTAKEQR